MRYVLLGYLRRGICLVSSLAFHDQAQLVLLGIGDFTRIEN